MQLCDKIIRKQQLFIGFYAYLCRPSERVVLKCVKHLRKPSATAIFVRYKRLLIICFQLSTERILNSGKKYL